MKNNMQPEILFEDKDVLVINKPAGLIVHSDGKTKEPTLTDWILKKYPELKDIGEPWETESGEFLPRPGIVHRLDRETSGAMLIAKNKKSFENLKKQFQEHKIRKMYHLFVWGEMKDDKGTIDRAIGRSAKDFRKRSAQRGARGQLREAVTDYRVLNRQNGYSFVEANPKTGRTHQIRVHFKAINNPIIGDSLYGPKRENSLGFSHTALHSYSVTFEDLKGKNHTVIAPYPRDFKAAVDSLHK